MFTAKKYQTHPYITMQCILITITCSLCQVATRVVRTITFFTLYCYRVRVGLGIPTLKHDRECLTELLERACFQPHAIQRIQLAEVGWESDNKGFERKRGWVVCIKSCATFPVLVWCYSKTTTVEQISLFKLICSKNDGLIYLIVLPVG